MTEYILENIAPQPLPKVERDDTRHRDLSRNRKQNTRPSQYLKNRCSRDSQERRATHHATEVCLYTSGRLGAGKMLTHRAQIERLCKPLDRPQLLLLPNDTTPHTLQLCEITGARPLGNSYSQESISKAQSARTRLQKWQTSQLRPRWDRRQS